MGFIEFGTKAVRIDKIEGVTLYCDKVTVYTANNNYTCYYQTNEIAKKVYKEILDKLTEEG